MGHIQFSCFWKHLVCRNIWATYNWLLWKCPIFCNIWATYNLAIFENEPFSTAERSERVANFFFRATREHTEAAIEQATVAMRCHGANSPEPRGRAVPGSDTSVLRAADTSALRAADQQLYNRTALTSWAHRGSLSKRRELVLSSLLTPPPFSPTLGPRSLKLRVSFPCICSPPVCIIHSVTSLSSAPATCTPEHPFFSTHCYPNTYHPMTHVSLEEAPSRLQHTVFPPDGLLLSGQGGCSRRPYQG